MTTQELIQEHVKEQCKYCDIQNCNGINITNNGKTKCEKTEEKIWKNV